jgi:hypothetical protein
MKSRLGCQGRYVKIYTVSEQGCWRLRVSLPRSPQSRVQDHCLGAPTFTKSHAHPKYCLVSGIFQAFARSTRRDVAYCSSLPSRIATPARDRMIFIISQVHWFPFFLFFCLKKKLNRRGNNRRVIGAYLVAVSVSFTSRSAELNVTSKATSKDGSTCQLRDRRQTN